MKTIRKRRKQAKTNYHKRMKLLKSEKPRLVLRKTNKYLIGQYVSSTAAQDKVVFGISTKERLKNGWPKERTGSLKTLSASYLLGILIGKKILSSKLDAPIFDFGLQRVIRGSKIQAFIKGVFDAGIKIKCNKESFPDDKRIEGIHLKEKIPFQEIKSKIDQNERKETRVRRCKKDCRSTWRIR